MEYSSFAPSFTGYIPETQDALLLFQAVIEGKLPLITSRPPDSIRDRVIRSGAVFIFREGPIKRWTDKMNWSPSRVLGNFLIYRELSGRRPRNDTNHNQQLRSQVDEFQRIRQGPAYQRPTRGINPELSLYGSLLDSYEFKPGGLIKKTISTPYRGDTYRLVSYYTAEDVQAEALLSPLEDPILASLQVDQALLEGIQFRMTLNSIPSPYIPTAHSSIEEMESEAYQSIETHYTIDQQEYQVDPDNFRHLEMMVHTPATIYDSGNEQYTYPQEMNQHQQVMQCVYPPWQYPNPGPL